MIRIRVTRFLSGAAAAVVASVVSSDGASPKRVNSDAAYLASLPLLSMPVASASREFPIRDNKNPSASGHQMPSPLTAAEAMARWPNLYVIPQTRAVRGLFTTLRDANSSQGAFVNAADRLMRILAEEGLAALPGCVEGFTVKTPVPNESYHGFKASPSTAIAAVSIVRAGDTLLEAARSVCPALAAGKILIQRDENDSEKRPKLFYVKLPPHIASRAGILLVDPMLATGQSAGLAIRELMARGVKEELIVFLNVVACPEGLDALFTAHPHIKVVTGAVDSYLNSSKYICPGLGDFGDRYFGTTTDDRVPGGGSG